jgi:hypothetical protein
MLVGEVVYQVVFRSAGNPKCRFHNASPLPGLDLEEPVHVHLGMCEVERRPQSRHLEHINVLAEQLLDRASIIGPNVQDETQAYPARTTFSARAAFPDSGIPGVEPTVAATFAK